MPTTRLPLFPLVTRHGSATLPADVDAVLALHRRASDESRHRRFHVPMPRVGHRLARRLLAPPGGWSLLGAVEGAVVAMACVGPVDAHTVEVGLLVEDAHQRHGYGSALLRQVADEAAARGWRAVVCVGHADDDAVERTVARAGLLGRSEPYDGQVRVTVPLGHPR